MEWIIWTTVGLFLDIVGAGIMILPILFLEKLRAQPRFLGEEALKQRNFAWVGFGLLAIGFGLQGYGNYLQYIN